MNTSVPCEEWLSLIDAACDGDITEADRARLEAHAASCAGCAGEWRSLAAVAAGLRAESPTPTLPPSAAERIRLIARNSVVAPRHPGDTGATRTVRGAGSLRDWAIAAAALVAVMGAAQFVGSSASRPLTDPSPASRIARQATAGFSGRAGIGNVGPDANRPATTRPAQGNNRFGSSTALQTGSTPGLTHNVPRPPTVENLFDELCASTDPDRTRHLAFQLFRDRAHAVPYFLTVLAGPDEARRLPAIEILGRAKDPRASRPLARLLDDPVCASAALRALGSIGDPVARVACLNALRREDLREDAVRALSRCADDSLVDPLVRAVAGGLLTPASAAEVARRMPPVSGHSPILSELRSDDPDRRDAATAILVECRDPAVRPFLEASFADRAGRPWAATQLVRLADPSCAPAILETAARDPDAEEDALQVLRAIGAAAIATLEPVLRPPTERGVRRRAIRLLGRLGDAAATPLLVEAAADPELRSEAVAALVRCGDRRAAPLFLSVVADRRLAPEAIAALGAWREASAIPVLIPALRRREVRDEALEALRQITREDFGLDASRWARWWKSRAGEIKNPSGVVAAASLARAAAAPFRSNTPGGDVPAILERSRS